MLSRCWLAALSYMPPESKDPPTVLLPGRIGLKLIGTGKDTAKVCFLDGSFDNGKTLKRPAIGWTTKVIDYIRLEVPGVIEALSITDADFETIQQNLVVLEGKRCPPPIAAVVSDPPESRSCLSSASRAALPLFSACLPRRARSLRLLQVRSCLLV